MYYLIKRKKISIDLERKSNLYSLSRNEKEEVQKFVNEHSKKGYICPSKSPQMLPVFFVRRKEDGYGL